MSRRLPLLLECLLCSKLFTTEDVAKKRYYPETLICGECYRGMQSQSAEQNCFGKLPYKKLPGYSEGNVCCSKLCADRVVCQTFIKKRK